MATATNSQVGAPHQAASPAEQMISRNPPQFTPCHENVAPKLSDIPAAANRNPSSQLVVPAENLQTTVSVASRPEQTADRSGETVLPANNSKLISAIPTSTSIPVLAACPTATELERLSATSSQVSSGVGSMSSSNAGSGCGNRTVDSNESGTSHESMKPIKAKMALWENQNCRTQSDSVRPVQQPGLYRNGPVYNSPDGFCSDRAHGIMSQYIPPAHTAVNYPNWSPWFRGSQSDDHTLRTPPSAEVAGTWNVDSNSARFSHFSSSSCGWTGQQMPATEICNRTAGDGSCAALRSGSMTSESDKNSLCNRPHSCLNEAGHTQLAGLGQQNQSQRHAIWDSGQLSVFGRGLAASSDIVHNAQQCTGSNYMKADSASRSHSLTLSSNVSGALQTRSNPESVCSHYDQIYGQGQVPDSMCAQGSSNPTTESRPLNSVNSCGPMVQGMNPINQNPVPVQPNCPGSDNNNNNNSNNNTNVNNQTSVLSRPPQFNDRSRAMLENYFVSASYPVIPYHQSARFTNTSYPHPFGAGDFPTHGEYDRGPTTTTTLSSVPGYGSFNATDAHFSFPPHHSLYSPALQSIFEEVPPDSHMPTPAGCDSLSGNLVVCNMPSIDTDSLTFGSYT